MDVYEKMSIAAQNNEFQTVAYQFGRAIRRSIIFDSMVSAPMDDDITIQPEQHEIEKVKDAIKEHVPRVMATTQEIWTNIFNTIQIERFEVPKYHELLSPNAAVNNTANMTYEEA
jgi:hypothetical protein